MMRALQLQVGSSCTVHDDVAKDVIDISADSVAPDQTAELQGDLNLYDEHFHMTRLINDVDISLELEASGTSRYNLILGLSINAVCFICVC